MKKLFLIVGALFALSFTSCEEEKLSALPSTPVTPTNPEDPENPDVPDKPDTPDVNTTKVLSTINISDAKKIFRKGVNSKSVGADNTYWKIDKDGNESKIALFDADKNEAAVTIANLIKVSNDFIGIEVNGEFAIMHINTISIDELGVATLDTTYSFEYQKGTFLADIKSERLFRIPNSVYGDIIYDLFNSTFESQQDALGNVFLCSYNNIIKLNTKDLTLSYHMKDVGSLQEFHVTKEGFIWCNTSLSESIIKCPGGRIYPIKSWSFTLNDNIYAYKGGQDIDYDTKIYQLKTVGGNDIEKEIICDFGYNDNYSFNSDGRFVGYNIYSMSYYFNHVKNTAILMGHEPNSLGSVSFEFDGVNEPKPAGIPNGFHSLGIYNLYPTSDAFCVLDTDNDKIIKLDLVTYEMSEILITEVDIKTLTSNIESPNLTFTGIEYASGLNVLGSISGGVVSIDVVLEDNQKVVDLIEIF